MLMLAAAVLAASPARAGGMPEPITDSSAGPSSAVSAAAQTDDGIIRLTPDKTRLLHIDQDAASVVVTNPAHAAVLLDSPRTLLLMPRAPGTTAFTVLDAKGKVILERNIVVTGAEQKKNYVRIRRSCGGQSGGGDCTPSAYYYCPDGCYEVTPVEGDQQTNVPPLAAAPLTLPQETNAASDDGTTTDEQPAPETPAAEDTSMQGDQQ
jgi:hypothetical protein